MKGQPSWVALAREFEKIPSPTEPLRAEWFAYEGSEDFGIWLLRPGGPATDAVRTTFSLLAARVIAKLRLAPLPLPRPQQHFPDWSHFISYLQGGKQAAGEEQPAGGLPAGGEQPAKRNIDFSDAVPYGLGEVDRDATDACTRAWLEWLRDHSPAFQSAEGEFSIGQHVYQCRNGSIEDLCMASAVACRRLAREEMADRLRQRLERTGSVQVKLKAAQERAQRRQAVVHPILEQKRWTRGRLVTKSGVGKATVYGYLDGTRASISRDSRRDIAEALGLKPEQLPL